MSEQQTVEVPETLSYDASDVERANTRPVLREGAFRFVVTGVQKSVSKNGHFMLALTCAPVDAEGKAKSPSIRHNVILPLANKAVPGHVAPNTLGLCQGFLQAIEVKGVTRFPRRVQGGEGYELDGKAMGAAEAQEYKNKLGNLILKTVVGYWANPEDLRNESFYGLVKQNGEFRNIDKVSATGEDWEILTSDFTE